VDLVAIADLLLAGRGSAVVACGEPLIELAAWVAHRRRRGEVRMATKDQLLTQLDRAFPGLCWRWRTCLVPGTPEVAYVSVSPRHPRFRHPGA
jgi:hypothetical protein